MDSLKELLFKHYMYWRQNTWQEIAYQGSEIEEYDMARSALWDLICEAGLEAEYEEWDSHQQYKDIADYAKEASNWTKKDDELVEKALSSDLSGPRRNRDVVI